MELSDKTIVLCYIPDNTLQPVAEPAKPRADTAFERKALLRPRAGNVPEAVDVKMLIC